MAGKTQLFSFWRSSCSYRVRAALNIKKIPYDYVPIDIDKRHGEQYSPEYIKINPMALVPALRIDGHTLTDSMAIIEYLEDTYPKPALLPREAVQRARMRAMCQIIGSTIQPLQNVGVLRYVNEQQREQWPQHWIARGFGAIEKILSSTAGKYCFGEKVSIADCFLVPQVFNARRYHVDLTPYPTIVRIDRELESNPAFQASHPYKQPDCPPKYTKK